MFTAADEADAVKAERNPASGEITIQSVHGAITLTRRITGSRSGVNEAIVSCGASSRSSMTGAFLLLVIRPYSETLLGGVGAIDFSDSGVVRINGRNCVAVTRQPDHVMTGSGEDGDITAEKFDSPLSRGVNCRYSMATLALAYGLSGTSDEFLFRISLEPGRDISAATVKKYEESAGDFSKLREIRAEEGIAVDVTDNQYMKTVNQCRLTMMNINPATTLPLSVEKARDSFFYVHGFIRAGHIREADEIVRLMIEGLSYDARKRDFTASIMAAYAIAAFYELYIHKRETEFLQQYFPELRKTGDYVYSFCTEIHNLSYLKSNTLKNCWIGGSSEHDVFVYYKAMSCMSYLSRCMGIFGHESRYKNEADRLQSITRDSFEKKRAQGQPANDGFRGLLAFPERVYMSPSEEEYNKLFRDLFISENFPVMDRIFGIDMYASFAVLNQMLLMRDARFHEFFHSLLSYNDDFFSLPEFINPVSGRGSWGDGNSMAMASLIFIIMRNMIFTDTPERLEFFPVPDEKMFAPGKRIKMERAPSRFGRLSFSIETDDREIRIVFAGLPKYVPADIQINLPFDTKILEGDDFIVKKKVKNTYYINGWPSAVRFQLRQSSHSS